MQKDHLYVIFTDYPLTHLTKQYVGNAYLTGSNFNWSNPYLIQQGILSVISIGLTLTSSKKAFCQ